MRRWDPYAMRGRPSIAARIERLLGGNGWKAKNVRLFDLFRRPEEVREAVSLMKELHAYFPEQDQTLLRELAEEGAKGLTSSRKEMEQFVRWIRGEGHSVSEWVYTYIINSTADRLESGHYHVYRGILNAQGEALRNIFERAIRLMLEMNTCTPEWADEHIRGPVFRNIKKIG